MIYLRVINIYVTEQQYTLKQKTDARKQTLYTSLNTRQSNGKY